MSNSGKTFLISYSLPVPVRLRHPGGRSGGLIGYFTLKMFIIPFNLDSLKDMYKE